MASAPRAEFSPALATAVVEMACALLSSERPASRQADVLSVEAAWTRVGCTPYVGPARATPTLALVKAVLIAHDEDPDPVFWPNLGGRVGRTKPGKTATQDNRDRGDRNRGDGGKKGGGVDHHHRRGGDSDGGGGGGASGAGLAEGAAEGATLVQQPGQLAAALAKATEGVGTAREDVLRGTTRQPPPARLRSQARTTTARWPW